MKTHTMKLITTNLALVAALAVLAGCASKSYDKGANTSKALQSAADAVAQTTTSVTGVLGALNALTFKSEGDLRKQYDAFVSAATKLDKSIATLAEKATTISNATVAYTESWTNQTAAIQSEELRKRSDERRIEVSAKLKEMSDSYAGVQKDFGPFTSDVKDIKTYLSTDLTPTGVATIKDIVSKTKADALPLRDSIKRLEASLASLSASLSPVIPSPAKK